MLKTLQKSLTQILRPLVRLMIRHGVSHSEFVSLARHVYVEEAASQKVDGKLPSLSRIAIITGINRKEVKKLLESPLQDNPLPTRLNRATRVVTGWAKDKEYHSPEGKPDILVYGDKNASFNLLVKKYGGDVPPRAMLDELLRSGTIEAVSENQYRLLRQAYVPQKSPDDMLALFGQQGADLLATMDYNLDPEHTHKRLQLSVAYDNLPREAMQEFRSISAEKSLAFLQDLDAYLSTQDRDNNQHIAGTDRFRGGIGLYFIEEQQRSEDHES